MKTQFALLTVLLALLLTAPALSDVEQARETERHVIYYNVLPTSALPEAMARAYNITRSDNRVLLNVTVRTRGEEESKAVPAEIDAQASNLTRQLKRFQMRKLSEDDAIYYVGDVGVTRGESLNFVIKVTPEGESQAERIEFRRNF